MSTQSNSSTTQVVQTGGSFGTAPANAQFKDQDYGEKALGTKENLRRFFTQLNPIVSRIKDLGDGGVNLSNLDADYLSFPLNAYQSEWTSVLKAVGGVVTAGTGIKCFDGSSGWIAVRKDAWGQVNLWIDVTTSGAGSLGATLSQEFWPPGAVAYQIPGTVATVTISATGALSISGAVAMGPGVILDYPSATLSPGTVPGVFPVYLKIAPGRTPVSVIFAGAKLQTNSDIYKTSTGLLGAALGCAWTFLGSSTKAADGSLINQVRIDSIPGLVAGQNYILNFLVFYGQTGTSSGS